MNRISLHYKLDEILKRHYTTKDPEDERVYYNPPANIHLKYPCIIYREVDIKSKNASDRRYHISKEYSVMVVTKARDSNIHEEILDEIPYSNYNMSYIQDNMNHTILRIKNQGGY